ncbi:MAG: filamentous hemagglutinin N-terminal domain-containing protein, partial [Desulfobacula sp.]
MTKFSIALCRKRHTIIMFMIFLMFFQSTPLYALPTGAEVVTNNGTITQNGSLMNIDQAGNKMITNWQSFGIGKGETVNFRQPSSSAIALNRVLGIDPSGIYGSLTANGRVFLINPNGVLFGAGAQVDVG